MKHGKPVVIILFLSVFFLFAALSALPAEALSAEEIIKSQAEKYGLNEIGNEIPEEALDIAEKAGIKVSTENFDDVLSADNLLKLAAGGIAEAARGASGLILKLAAVILAAFIYDTVSKSCSSVGISGAVSFIMLAVCGLILFESVYDYTMSFSGRFTELSGFTAAVIPVMTASMTAAGAANGAIAFGGICVMFTGFFNYVCSSFVLPFSNMYLAVSLSSCISDNFNLKRLSSFLRNLMTGFLALLLTVFSGIMSIQSSIAMSADTLLKKTVKYAVSAGIPILGGAVSDGLDTFFTSALVVKNSAGMLGIAVTAVISSAAIAEILVFFIVLSVLCFFFSFFENSILMSFVSAARDIAAILLAIALSLCIMTFLLFAVMIKVS